MHWFLVSIFLCYILFLFFLYRLGREDFVLIRKNIALEQLFDLTFITTIIAVLAGRLAYAILHLDKSFLNPLKFFVIPYFPGFVLPGAIAGAFLFLWLLYKKKKTPSGRLIDFYAISLLSIMPFLTLAEQFLFPRGVAISELILSLIYAVIFFIFMFILMPRLSRGEIKDGSVGLTFLGILAIISFLQDSFIHKNGIISFLYPEDFFYLFLVIIVIGSLLVHELWQPKKRSRRVLPQG